ncbi:MAG: flagellar assembly protein FliH [Azoarcus sp.]|jgi:flagellar assembly protein FliH|nr:flagellar assembly protein FliH [Azoarcus sp.]
MNKTVSFSRHQAVGAYRRWEPPDFDTPAPPPPAPEKRAQKPSAPPATEPAPPPTPALKLPTAADIERIHEEARKTGFDEGFAEGRDSGFAEGKEAGYRAGHDAGFEEGQKEGQKTGFEESKTATEAEAQRLNGLVTQLESSLKKLDTEIAEELLSLSVELARKVLQHTLAVEPEAVVSAIRAVLQTLPQIRAQIHLNPDDVALAHKYLGDELNQGGHILLEDETVSRGGCRVETPSAEIDATMETRWRRTIESLGREHAPWVAVPDRRTKSRRSSDKDKTPHSRKETAAEPPPQATPPENP